MNRYFLFFTALIFVTGQSLAGMTPTRVSVSIPFTYSAVDMDGDYVVAARETTNNKGVVLYQISIGGTPTVMDNGHTSSYCNNSFDEIDPYDASECSSFSCEGVSYSQLNIEGNYVTFVKTMKTYTCDGTLTTVTSYSIGVYDILNANLSSISADGTVSSPVMDNSSLVWIDDGNVKRIELSSGTKTTILE